MDSKSDTNLIETMVNMVEKNSVEEMIDRQRNMLARFEKTNEMLVNCNVLAAERLLVSGKYLKKYSSQLSEMKKDLDLIHKRIGTLKHRFRQQYPHAVNATSNVLPEEGDDMENLNRNQ